MSKTPLVTEEDYQITAQTTEGLIFLHCDVYNISKSVLQDIRDVFEILCAEAALQGHYSMFTVTPNERFVKALGKPYEVIDKVIKDEEEYEVVAWDLTPYQLAS